MSTIPKMQVIDYLHCFNYPMPNFDLFFLVYWHVKDNPSHHALHEMYCSFVFSLVFSLVLSFFACTLSLVLIFLALIHTYQHSHVITCAHILVIPIHLINCEKPQSAMKTHNNMSN